MANQGTSAPRILLSALWDGKLKSYWMLPAYTELLLKLGAEPFILPLGYKAETLGEVLQDFDGLLLCGGDDLNPTLYGEEPHPELGTFYEPRDTQELELFKAAAEMKMPVFGICRGLQLINAALGGTLYQDIPSQFPTKINHHMEAPYDVPAHKILLKEGGLLAGLTGEGSLEVNSCHHQAIKELAEPLCCEAAAEDGLCEAVAGKDPDHYIAAVQWHPEFMYKNADHSAEILGSFVDAAEAYRRRKGQV